MVLAAVRRTPALEQAAALTAPRPVLAADDRLLATSASAASVALRYLGLELAVGRLVEHGLCEHERRALVVTDHVVAHEHVPDEDRVRQDVLDRRLRPRWHVAAIGRVLVLWRSHAARCPLSREGVHRLAGEHPGDSFEDELHLRAHLHEHVAVLRAGRAGSEAVRALAPDGTTVAQHEVLCARHALAERFDLHLSEHDREDDEGFADLGRGVDEALGR